MTLDDCRTVDSQGKLQFLEELEDIAKKKMQALEEISEAPTPETYQTEAEFHQGRDPDVPLFPYFRRTKHNTSKPPGEPTWSQQLGMLFANFGDVCRSNLWKVKEYQDQTYRVPSENDIWNRNRFLDYISSSGTHLIGIMEADTIGTQNHA